RAGRERRDGGRPARDEPLTGAEGAREEALRAWRRRRSQADSVPAYVVFSDATLRAIASRAPTTARELAGVPGIGPAKLERYGVDVLALVAADPGAPAEP
ncbi:HRDC domain-containing protein, partial [Iamia sp.]|uniref:HRDC domain-containing protein n=1 Tax=Iamia sp. TaxID=2722710 RepID=UPI002B70E5F7